MTSQTEVKLCSKEECENIIESDLPDTLILYFSDRQHSVFYNGKEVRLSINQAEMLRLFMLNNNEKRPTIKQDFADLFSIQNDDGEIPDNTFIQAVSRLKRKLARCLVPATIIGNQEYMKGIGYAYDQTVPFMVIQRTDDI